ncbi:MAG: bis(5'-nucleosyl)-tetraphosphatase (symmetrical) YqeK [Bacillota bacterium]
MAHHVEIVAANALELARRTGTPEGPALTAAWLHDISLVLPYAEMAEHARRHGVPLLPEEIQAPQLIHGKLSALMAEQFFGVGDPAVLDAIRCHSTLRPNPTLLDKLLFIADKRSWPPHEAPYQAALEAALTNSLDEAVACFLDWSWQQRYPVIHLWLRQAHAQFCSA